MSTVLLDTCTFIWLTASPKKLSAAAKKAIDRTDTLLISDVTVLEICLKWRSGKLQLPNPPRSWVQEQAEIWKLNWLSLTRSHIFRASELEPMHQDPYDRLLVGQALEEQIKIVTPDEHIERYPVATIW